MSPNRAEIRDWHWCGEGHKCLNDEDCRQLPSCVDFSGGFPSNIHCGLGSQAYSCWTRTFTTTAAALHQPAPTSGTK
ncbi:hypothetical protein AJ78_06968 [Emergomyces pasteurianus Ep9510]|uniref:Uncharacterized protein n=1 Tax=Emergomyces pasteurianus Ep9510 TaxID=1447872 RepID=A0A1J9PX28_9EURO|nr:hypothetical protein AJ78_06968 [Emergomyces pasteurianus Ep9510]